MINLETLSWNAIAILLLGLATIVAAVIVSLRQARIIERQVALEELIRRQATFDRRFAAFERIRDYVGAVLHTPNPVTDVRQTIAYFDAVSSLRFLFSKPLFVEMEALRQAIQEYVYLHKLVGRYPEPDGEKLTRMALDEIAVRKVALKREYTALPSLFEREMGIGEAADAPDRIAAADPDEEPDVIARLRADLDDAIGAGG